MAKVELSTGDHVEPTRIVDLPGNSHKEKEYREKQEAGKRPPAKKVIKGKAVTKKKSIGKRIVDTFVDEDVEDVKGYIFFDVIIPMVKDVIVDAGIATLESIFYGTSGSRYSSRRNSGRTNYGKISTTSGRDRGRDRERSGVRGGARYSCEDVILDSKSDAEEVLSQLVDLIEDYGAASVADLYDMVGISGQFTDNYWGWRDLSSATTRRVRDGYLIDLPKTINIKD